MGGRCRRMAGSAAYQRVDRPYSLLAQNEGPATDQTEKAFVFRAETEISWSPFPTKAGAPVGTRLHRPRTRGKTPGNRNSLICPCLLNIAVDSTLGRTQVLLQPAQQPKAR